MTYRYKGFEADTVEEIIALRDALDGDDWIEWDGREFNPRCSPEELVEVKFRSGERITRESRMFRWVHTDHPGDIVAYRIVGDA